MKRLLSLTILAVFLISLLIFGCTKKEKEIKIGAILPLSGYAAQYGKWIQEALELARERTNKHGGIRGRKLEIIYEDDQAIPTIAANAMNKLCKVNKVPVVIGSWASSCVLAQAPIANRTHTVLIALAASPKIRDAGDYIFRVAPDARLPLPKLVSFIIKRGDKTIAILYINNDFGKDQAAVFKEKFERAGGIIVMSEAYNSKSLDFRTLLTKVKQLKPDGIFLVG